MPSPFLTNRPGQDQIRVYQPSGFAPDDGDYVLVMGAKTSGYKQRFNVGDKIELAQSASFTTEDVLNFVGKVKGPVGTMPSVSGSEPFALADGQTLQIQFDETTTDNVTFDSADFSNIAAATAIEVRDAIAASITNGSVFLTGDGGVGVVSNKTGRQSRARIVGGTAAGTLAFQELMWIFKVFFNAVEVASTDLIHGEERDLSEMGGNLSNYSSPVNVTFRLILGVRA